VDVGAVRRLNGLASACTEDLEDKGRWTLKLNPYRTNVKNRVSS
jgi:hypothetical protein